MMDLYKVVYDRYIPARSTEEAINEFLKYLRTQNGLLDASCNTKAFLEEEDYEGGDWDD
jgi:hypothetical protein